jgi:hypothetical protein
MFKNELNILNLFRMFYVNSLQPDVRILIIILKAEAMLVGGHQMIFVRCL